MKRTFLLLVITMLATTIVSARVGAVLRGLRYMPRYQETIRPMIIGGFVSSTYRFSENSYPNDTALSLATYYNTITVTPTVQTKNSQAISTNEDCSHSISQIVANTNASRSVAGTVGISESGSSVWLYILFGMMALAAIALIYLLFGDCEEYPVVCHQAFVSTKPLPRHIELANGGGIIIC